MCPLTCIIRAIYNCGMHFIFTHPNIKPVYYPPIVVEYTFKLSRISFEKSQVSITPLWRVITLSMVI